MINNSSSVSTEKKGGHDPQLKKGDQPNKSGLLSFPLIIGLAILAVGGIFLLNRADAQARDTIRKHHLQDLEDALQTARGVHGTYPPYAEATWCGFLDNTDPQVQAQIEEILRQQNELYENPDKPFPVDPLLSNSINRKKKPKIVPQNYFYWKHSPSSFELFALLEEDPQEIRSTEKCLNISSNPQYNYSLTSVWRENS